MTRILTTIVLSVFTFTSYAQNIEYTAGFNHNVLYDTQDDSPFTSTSYQSKSGFYGHVAIEDIKFEWMKFRFTLGMEHLQGEFTASEGGQSGGTTNTGDYKKTNITFGVYPINKLLLRHIDFNLGIEVSKRFQETLNGTSTISSQKNSGSTVTLNERYNDFTKGVNTGIKARLAYDLKFNETWLISPQYEFYFGLNHEFNKLPKRTKSIRHYIGIGMQKIL